MARLIDEQSIFKVLLFNLDLGLTAQGVVDILAGSLSQDHRKAASLVVDYLPINQGIYLVNKDTGRLIKSSVLDLDPVEEADEDEMEEDSPREDKLQDALRTAERLLTTQIKALEILTNLCCPADADSLDEDQYYQDESCSEEGSLTGDGIEECALELNPDLKSAFLQAGLFQAVIERAKLPAVNIVEALSQHSNGILLV